MWLLLLRRPWSSRRGALGRLVLWLLTVRRLLTLGLLPLRLRLSLAATAMVAIEVISECGAGCQPSQDDGRENPPRQGAAQSDEI